MKEKELNYKKISEEIVKQIKHHEETIDENGVVIPAYDEEVEVVKPIMGEVYEEMTQEEILSLENETSDKAEPTLEERIEALECATLEMILNGGAL